MDFVIIVDAAAVNSTATAAAGLDSPAYATALPKQPDLDE